MKFLVHLLLYLLEDEGTQGSELVYMTLSCIFFCRSQNPFHKSSYQSNSYTRPLTPWTPSQMSAGLCGRRLNQGKKDFSLCYDSFLHCTPIRAATVLWIMLAVVNLTEVSNRRSTSFRRSLLLWRTKHRVSQQGMLWKISFPLNCPVYCCITQHMI